MAGGSFAITLRPHLFLPREVHASHPRTPGRTGRSPFSEHRAGDVDTTRERKTPPLPCTPAPLRLRLLALGGAFALFTADCGLVGDDSGELRRGLRQPAPEHAPAQRSRHRWLRQEHQGRGHARRRRQHASPPLANTHGQYQCTEGRGCAITSGPHPATHGPAPAPHGSRRTSSCHLRPSPQNSSICRTRPASTCSARHNGHETTPGSTSSSPSNSPAIRSGVRRW